MFFYIGSIGIYFTEFYTKTVLKPINSMFINFNFMEVYGSSLKKQTKIR